VKDFYETVMQQRSNSQASVTFSAWDHVRLEFTAGWEADIAWRHEFKRRQERYWHAIQKQSAAAIHVRTASEDCQALGEEDKELQVIAKPHLW
jgi:hypothetical protein